MKNKLKRIKTPWVIASVVTLFTALICFGQVAVQNGILPAWWVAGDGDYFGITTNAVPQTRVGTNTYTAISTNFLVTTPGPLTNTLVVVNGIIVEVQ